MKCAHCESELNDSKFGHELLSIKGMSPSRTAVLRALIKAKGTVISNEQLVLAIYGLRKCGSPLWADKTLAQHIFFLRHYHGIKNKGYAVINVRGFGYRLTRIDNVVPFCKAA